MDIGSQIEWRNLTKALDFYESKGYQVIDVPWLVDGQSIRTTIPDGIYPLELVGTSSNTEGIPSFLVGSAEQSFIYLMLNDKLPPGKYCTLTPCFRDEKYIDDLTRIYFAKVELINTESVDERSLIEMSHTAQEFYSNFKEVMYMYGYSDGSIDLMCKGVELGSYGIRERGNLRWIYGTGCAEPRCSKILGRL